VKCFFLSFFYYLLLFFALVFYILSLLVTQSPHETATHFLLSRSSSSSSLPSTRPPTYKVFFFLNGYSLFIYIYQPSAYRPPRSALLYIYIYEQIRTNRQLALVTRCSLLVYPNYYFVPVVISLLCFSFSSSSSSLHHWHTQCQKTKPCIKIWLLFFFSN